MGSNTTFSATSFVTLNLPFFFVVVNPSSVSAACPNDALKLGVCVKALNGLVDVTIGTPPVLPCCGLIEGLVDLEAVVCLCTTIKAVIAGINLNLPIYLSLVLGGCGKNMPNGFKCA